MVDVPGRKGCGERVVVAEAERASVVVDASDLLDGTRGKIQFPVAYRPSLEAVFTATGDEPERRLMRTADSDQLVGECRFFAEDLCLLGWDPNNNYHGQLGGPTM